MVPVPKVRAGGNRAPPVNLTVRGSKELALTAAATPEGRAAALEAYRRDIRSANDTSDFYVVTWRALHDAWWAPLGSPIPDVFPLTTAKIEKVGALLKAGRYRSAGNYMSSAKGHHL